MIVAHRWIALLVAAALARVARGQWLTASEMTFVDCVSIGLTVVAASSALAVITRTASLAASTHHAVSALQVAPPSPMLRAAVDRTGIRRVVCLNACDRAAFCAGVLRPRVYVTTGMLLALRAEELDAVLLHEREHAIRRDPARRVVVQAAADVLFYVPLVRWWCGQQRERAELAADRAAVALVGREPVAGALLAATAVQPLPAVGFDGAAHARVAQLLGEELPHSSPAPVTWLVSLGGLALVIMLVMCVGQGVEYLLSD